MSSHGLVCRAECDFYLKELLGISITHKLLLVYSQPEARTIVKIDCQPWHLRRSSRSSSTSGARFGAMRGVALARTGAAHFVSNIATSLFTRKPPLLYTSFLFKGG